MPHFLDVLIQDLTLGAIRFYQRHLSPYKGFCCAYRQHTGRAGCSALGYRAVRRYGWAAGLALTRQRTWLCGVAYRRHRAGPSGARHPLSAQRGVCDAGCDLPCDGPCDLSDWLGCWQCGSCDWPSRSGGGRARAREREKEVYLPPRVRSRVEPGRPREDGPGAGGAPWDEVSRRG